MDLLDTRERTLVLVKPDGMKRGLAPIIKERFLRARFKLVASKEVCLTREQVKGHLPGTPMWIRGMGEKFLENCRELGLDPQKIAGSIYPMTIGEWIHQDIYQYLMSGLVFAMVLEGPDAVAMARKHIGHTLPSKAAPGTIRGDFSIHSALSSYPACRNIVHGSGTVEEAKNEIANLFTPAELSEAEPNH